MYFRNILFLFLNLTLMSVLNIKPDQMHSSSPLTQSTNCTEECTERCMDVSHCTQLINDACNCCPICVRHLNESCGPGIGVCEQSLLCKYNNQSEIGSCVVTWPNDCDRAKCEKVYLDKCSNDSRLVIPQRNAGECCAQPGYCKCDLQKCFPTIPVCAKGEERVLIREGTSEPGNCCDIFECKQPELHCESVICNKENMFVDEECPEDSVRAASYVPAGKCCPIHPGCRCRASICLPARCPEGKRIRILKKGDGTPGRCCDDVVCERMDEIQPTDTKQCPYGEGVYEDSETWHSNSCEVCKCKAGIALCSKMSCASPPSHCTWVAIPENECCPICMGCQADGERRKRNEKWQKDDCTSCTCGADGVQYCQKHMCQVECDSPRKVAGQCCPVCDEPTIILNPSICPSLEYCPLRCENGLLRDAQGCFQCICAPVNRHLSVTCQSLTEANCDKICAHGYLRNEKGCTVCKCAKCPPLHQCYKHCLYGFETNNYGCPVCKCRTMSRIDATLLSVSKNTDDWDKCFSMSSHVGKLVERDSGEWWHDGCRQCFCEQKNEYCSLISCPERDPSCPIELWQRKEGACCASCDTSLSQHEHTVCQSAGRLFVDGETWQMASCISCTCRVGNVLCRVVQCPPIACAEPEFDPENKCCFRCPLTNFTTKDVSESITLACTDKNSVAHAEGTSWRADECTSCKCLSDENGPKIECYEEKCVDDANCLGLPLMVKGRCCPICSDVLSSGSICTYKKNIYSVNEEWHDGPCRNCTCYSGGRTICKEYECAVCTNSLPMPEQCCPACKESGWRSFGEGKTHSVLIDADNNATMTTTIVYGFCLLGFLLITVIALIVVYKIIKWGKKIHKKSPITFNNSAVLLASSRPIGSTPRLCDVIATRRSSYTDGQCDSLISTVSDSSSATSSNGSSTHGPHFDTLPLTPKASVTRTKSVDYGSGIRRGFGSFKANALSKLGEKHGSCNV